MPLPWIAMRSPRLGTSRSHSWRRSTLLVSKQFTQQANSIGVMHDAVQDGISQRWIAKDAARDLDQNRGGRVMLERRCSLVWRDGALLPHARARLGSTDNLQFLLVPGVTALMAWLFLGEGLSLLAIAGLVAAPIGCFLVATPRTPRAPAPSAGGQLRNA
jgi:hypothetical protein